MPSQPDLDTAPLPQKQRSPRWLLWLAVFAALRCLFFSASFPFFSNLDEAAHTDTVLKYASGQLPTKGYHFFEEETEELFLLWDSPQFRSSKESLAEAGGLIPHMLGFIEKGICDVVLGQNLGDFHTGFRAYSRRVLETIPYRGNSDNFVFDTQVLVQCVHFGFKIGDVPVPVRYYDDSSSINFVSSAVYGLKTLGYLCRFLLQKTGLFKFSMFRRESSART